MLDLKDKIILAHRGYFNSDSRKHYKESSKEVCQISSKKDYISIVELDIRKSKDGILWCYHGNVIEYCIGLKFSRNFNFIKEKYKVNTLLELLEVIDSNKIILLDLKNTSITKQDILNVFKNKKFKEVIFGNKSTSFLERFNEMPKEFVKLMNGNIFSPFYNPEKLKNKGYKYFEVLFPFQINKRLIEKIEKNGMTFTCPSMFFFSKESYWRKVRKYNIKII